MSTRLPCPPPSVEFSINMRTLVVVVVILTCAGGGWGDMDDAIRAFLIVAEAPRNCTKASDTGCPVNGLNFFLFTRSTSQFKLDQTTLSSAPFVNNAPFEVIIHGYNTTINDSYLVRLRKSYLERGEYNIIAVDWYALCVFGCYYHATENVPPVGRCVAQFMSDVARSVGNISIHLVGHSLGAHVSFWASQYTTFDRVTGLDPAGPLFGNNSKLNVPSKAVYTDVYHCNVGFLGQKNTTANLAVRFNDAVFQPGCGCDAKCSHIRCVEYFSVSNIKPEYMKAFPCGGWQQYRNDQCMVPTAATIVPVGEDADRTRSGSYMMFTNASFPFVMDPALFFNEAYYKSFKITASTNCPLFSFHDYLGK